MSMLNLDYRSGSAGGGGVGGGISQQRGISQGGTRPPTNNSNKRIYSKLISVESMKLPPNSGASLTQGSRQSFNRQSSGTTVQINDPFGGFIKHSNQNNSSMQKQLFRQQEMLHYQTQPIINSNYRTNNVHHNLELVIDDKSPTTPQPYQQQQPQQYYKNHLIFEYDGNNKQRNEFYTLQQQQQHQQSRVNVARSRGTMQRKGQLSRLDEENFEDEEQTYNRRQRDQQQLQQQQQMSQNANQEVIQYLMSEHSQRLSIDPEDEMGGQEEEEEEENTTDNRRKSYFENSFKHGQQQHPEGQETSAEEGDQLYLQNDDEIFKEQHHQLNYIEEDKRSFPSSDNYVYGDAIVSSRTPNNGGRSNIQFFNQQNFQITPGGDHPSHQEIIDQYSKHKRINGGSYQLSQNDGRSSQNKLSQGPDSSNIQDNSIIQQNRKPRRSILKSGGESVMLRSPHTDAGSIHQQKLDSNTFDASNRQQFSNNDSLSTNTKGDVSMGSPVHKKNQISPVSKLQPQLLNRTTDGSFKLQMQQTQSQHPFNHLTKTQRSMGQLSQSSEEPLPMPDMEWKYIEQPTLSRFPSIIYHVNRMIKLDLDLTIPGRPNVIRQQLITQQALDDFYQTRIKSFPNSGRELELQEPYQSIFADDQADTEMISDIENKIISNIQRSIEFERNEIKESLNGPPLLIKTARSPQLFFNSRFESGNLREVEQITEVEYNLYLSFDFNTTNYTQWYYFSVRNIKKGFHYTFNIMNLQKEESSYQQGMKPFVYSVKRNRVRGTNDWTRGGENIEYFKSNLKTRTRQCAPDYPFDPRNLPFNIDYDENNPPTVQLNTLTFNFSFDYDEDIVFFSQFQPYTHEDLQDYLFMIQKRYPHDYTKNVLRIEELCKTIEGRCCPIVTICDNVHKEADYISGSNGKDQRQVIFLTSRVHPGESNASFIAQGIIDFLLQQNKEAQYLREQFIFKIIPMLNPDGVVRGNYRCNVLGVDLNRRWGKPSKILHPTIYYAKQILKTYLDNQVLVYCDMHGHSRKRNVFMYGCLVPQSEINNHKYNNLIRMLPYMLNQRNKFFQFNDCKFANELEKESTARIVMFKEFNILNSYTLESTFYSPYDGDRYKKKLNLNEKEHIRADDLSQLGADFLLTIYFILQSKIMRRKFLQLEGPDGKLLPAPIIGKPNKDPKDAQIHDNSKPNYEKTIEKVKGSHVDSSVREYPEPGGQNFNSANKNNFSTFKQAAQTQQYQTQFGNSQGPFCSTHQHSPLLTTKSPFYQPHHPHHQYPSHPSFNHGHYGIGGGVGHGVNSVGTNSTANFEQNSNSTAQLINGQSNSYIADFSHYGTSEFQKNTTTTIGMTGGQGMVNGVSLRKRSQRNIHEESTSDIAVRNQESPDHQFYKSTPQKSIGKIHQAMMYGAVIGSGGHPNFQHQIDTNNQIEIIKQGGQFYHHQFTNPHLSSPSMTNVTVVQEQKRQQQVKVKPVIKIMTGINGGVGAQATKNGPTASLQMSQGSPQIQSTTKVAVKTTLMKSSVLEPPQSVSAILPDQVMNFGRTIGPTPAAGKNNNSIDFFKMYHNNNKLGVTRNIRGLLNQNIIQTATSITTTTPNHNSNPQQQPKRSSNIHILTNPAPRPQKQQPNQLAFNTLLSGNSTGSGGGNIFIQQTSSAGGSSPQKNQISGRDRERQLALKQQNLPLSSLFGGNLPQSVSLNQHYLNNQGGLQSGSPTMFGPGVSVLNQGGGMNQDCLKNFAHTSSQVVSIQVPHDIERLPQIIQRQFLKKKQSHHYQMLQVEENSLASNLNNNPPQLLHGGET